MVECEEDDEDCEETVVVVEDEEEPLECFANEEGCPDEFVPTIEDIETIGGNGEGDITNEEEDKEKDKIIWPDADEEEETEDIIIVVDEVENITDDVNIPYDPFGLGAVDEVFVEEEKDEKVTIAPTDNVQEEGGMSAAAIAFMWLFIIFIVIPLLIVLACFIII